jgi:gamma-glutamylcyclotransferase (GGCT)/AIG2-like uncharacterized protein YtfP
MRVACAKDGSAGAGDRACSTGAALRIAKTKTPMTHCRLFVYGTLLDGERDHALIGSAEKLGASSTEPAFHLVDLGAWAALVPGGSTAVVGELYLVDLMTRAGVDVERQVPILFQRVRILLGDGTEAESYIMTPDQARGRRKLHHGDWRKRFTRDVPPAIESPFVRWARNRS